MNIWFWLAIFVGGIGLVGVGIAAFYDNLDSWVITVPMVIFGIVAACIGVYQHDHGAYKRWVAACHNQDGVVRQVGKSETPEVISTGKTTTVVINTTYVDGCFDDGDHLLNSITTDTR